MFVSELEFWHVDMFSLYLVGVLNGKYVRNVPKGALYMWCCICWHFLWLLTVFFASCYKKTFKNVIWVSVEKEVVSKIVRYAWYEAFGCGELRIADKFDNPVVFDLYCVLLLLSVPYRANCWLFVGIRIGVLRVWMLRYFTDGKPRLDTSWSTVVPNVWDVGVFVGFCVIYGYKYFVHIFV